MAKIGVQKDRGLLYSDECLMLKRTLPCGAAAKLSIAHRLSFLGVIRDGKRRLPDDKIPHWPKMLIFLNLLDDGPCRGSVVRPAPNGRAPGQPVVRKLRAI